MIHLQKNIITTNKWTIYETFCDTNYPYLFCVYLMVIYYFQNKRRLLFLKVFHFFTGRKMVFCDG